MTRGRAASAALVAAVLLGAARPARAQDARGIYLELPALDLPFNAAHRGRLPSMAQSLWVSTDAYELLHTGLRGLIDPLDGPFWKRLLGWTLFAATDFVTSYLPPFLAWQHEEWHRAVMSRRGIDSFNDVYKFSIFSEAIAVSRVRDEDLVRLKREHPAEQVRLSTAGIEGNYELAVNLEKVAFFRGSRAFHGMILPLLMFQNSFYLLSCAGSDADAFTDRMNAEDGADVARRDFTGFDCTAWTYDLFRPDEPYEMRGVHPSGVGIDRYRKWSHLNEREQRYLRTQAFLSLLNLLDPQIVGFGRFVVGETAWNAAVRHLPTAFGWALRGDLFLARRGWGLFSSLYAFVAADRLLPGLDLALLDTPFSRERGWPVSPSARLALWLQPEDQRYEATGIAPGALAALRVGWPLGRFEPYLEVEAKSAGWVAGNVYLGPNLTARTGVAARVF